MKLVHYRKKCIGCNSCVEHAPEFWSISEKDGKADLHGSDNRKDVFVRTLDDINLEENEKAARDCPVSIIKIEK